MDILTIHMPKKKPILLEGLEEIKLPKAKLPKIKPVGKYILGVDREERRVSIPSATKKAVYNRVRGRCQSCGMPMKMTDKGAQFHHTRKPTVKSKPPTIQFLCATCHRRYGHEKYTVTKQDPYGIGTVKETKIKRKKVHKHKSPYWKKKRKTTKKKPRTKMTTKDTKTRKKTR